jgi:hypothetical protein
MFALNSASRLVISRRAAEDGLTTEQALADTTARERLLLCARDFAVIAELPLWKVYRLAADDDIPHQRQGRRVFFSIADTLLYLELSTSEGHLLSPSCENTPRRRTLLLSRNERRLGLCHPPGRFED